MEGTVRVTVPSFYVLQDIQDPAKRRCIRSYLSISRRMIYGGIGSGPNAVFVVTKCTSVVYKTK